MGSRKVKILHLITHMPVGGAQDNTLLTVEKHNRDDFCVHLAANPSGAWTNRALSVADVFHPLPHLVTPIHPLDDLKALFEIVKLLKQERFEIVHTHSSKAGMLGRLAARIVGRSIVVHTIHGFPFHDFMPAWKRNIYIGLERLARSWTDYFITVCDLNRQEALELNLLDAHNAQTVYSGIDFSKLDSSGEISTIYQTLEISPELKTIMMVGRLDDQKAPYYLIEAFSNVLQQYPNVILLLVGDGPLRPQLEQQVNELGIQSSVRFLGSRTDVPHLLKGIDIFALSSLWEGLGRAMTEAMLLGKPVVVPAIHGIPETVHDNETGLLFPAGDVPQLTHQLLHVLQHPDVGIRLGANAKALTRRLFDGDRMVQQIEDIYGKLLSQEHQSVPRKEDVASPVNVN